MNYFDWLPWIVGAPVVAGGIALIAMPSLLPAVGAWLSALSPLIKGLAEGVVEFFKTQWEGFKDMADNPSSIVFVATCCLITAWSVYTPPVGKFETKTYEQCVTMLRPDWKFIRRPKGEPIPDTSNSIVKPFWDFF